RSCSSNPASRSKRRPSTSIRSGRWSCRACRSTSTECVMGQIRFSTVRDLFDAFPSAARDVGAADDSMRTLDFVRSLIGKRDWQPAISVCAYLLPRRVAVAWACRSIRRMVERLRPDEDRMIGFAEAWVEEPEEPRRRKALAAGNAGDARSSATWVALAAGWSGGSIVPEDKG